MGMRKFLNRLVMCVCLVCGLLLGMALAAYAQDGTVPVSVG